MIKCKDFAPRITERGPFGGASEYESFSEVVSTVNQWIENTMSISGSKIQRHR
jgi:hypothetical protein